MKQIVFQNNIKELKTAIEQFDSKRIFLVRGKNSFTNSGAEEFINKLLFEKQIISFSNFETNPQLSDIKKGIELFIKQPIDLIVAIGGGSIIDMAKLISLFAYQTENLEDIVVGKASITEHKTPLIAIPTTAGTGSEATHFAVLYMGKKKYSVAHELILPDFVYLSSEFSNSAPPYLTACTGLDAFCQAIESVWSVYANDDSIRYGLEAIHLVWKNLSPAVNANSIKAKRQMQYASYLAGKAINITKTTAPHAISYAFTSYYGIPHGHAVAISLPYFLNYNYAVTESDCTDSKGVNAVMERIHKILDILECSIEESYEKLNHFFLDLGIQISIDQLIPNFNPKLIADNVNTERLNNNPRTVTKKAIESFLGKTN
ncbi:MAG: phosphonoacetaldehyde reductase [Salinivirgaceae bacterium]|jgi:alcohol dehydrogenase class IV|nr:phosphonoacetaldehyde reductase [Salinivirgaceae bacterium]